MKPIITKHLLIREFTLDDFSDFANLMANEEVMRFSLAGPMSLSLSQEYFERRILGHYKQYGFGLWAVFIQETKEFIGLAGLISQTIEGKEEVELAYRLHPDYWGKGYATEAASTIAEHAFKTLGNKYIISIIDPKNVSSEKVALRVGMHLWKQTVFHGFPVNIYQLFNKNPSL